VRDVADPSIARLTFGPSATSFALASFRLADAQELVARHAGFDGWQELISGAHTVKGRPKKSSTRPALRSIEAQLYVADVEASSAFYCAKLGFAIPFVYGDPPFFGQVHRDDARLNLRLVCEPVFVGDMRERESLISASITVAPPADIKNLFLEFQASDVRFSQALKKQPWGARTFIVIDPDGNLVSFAGPAE
jgi:catechol 2,3-dioxygenase-like lactoylglutathione lyase family enzyme